VVRGGDDHGIDVLLKQLTIVQVSSCQTVGTFLDCIAMGRVDVAHGHNLVRADLIRGIEEALHPLPGADDSDAYRVVRAEDTG